MEKVLYITYNMCDYIDDMVFCGLPYTNFDCYFLTFSSQTAEERYNNSNSKGVYQFIDEWYYEALKMKPFDPRIIYDYIIIGANTRDSVDTARNTTGRFRILIDGSDKLHDGHENNFHVYNKIFMRESSDPERFLPMCCPRTFVERGVSSKLKYNINFQCAKTYHTRIDIAKHLLDMNLDDCLISLGSGWKNTGNFYDHVGTPDIGNVDFTSMRSYQNVLEESRIIISERGAGKDTFRLWEAMSTGNIVLASRENVSSLLDGNLPANVFIFNDLNELSQLIESKLKLTDDEIMNARIDHKSYLMNHHIPANRAKHVLGIE